MGRRRIAVPLDELPGCTEAQNVPGTGEEHANWRRVETIRGALDSLLVLWAGSALASARRASDRAQYRSREPSR